MAPSFPAGKFKEAVSEAWDRARASPSLEPIPHRVETLTDGADTFALFIAPGLQKRTPAAKADPTNPFLKVDEALTVCAVPPAHLCVFNKYPVFERHLLIITKTFEEQTSLLALADFEALVTCFSEIDGLCFYNSGPQAGASQRHKHLQLVPFPLEGVDPQWLEARAQNTSLPFVHAREQTPATPALMFAAYSRLLHAIGCNRPGAAYNLLITRNTMWAIARVEERAQGVGVNALGFAGSIFARDDAEAATIRKLGPMTLLRTVARPKPDEAPENPEARVTQNWEF